MFKIGEFSKLGQVSTRMLRHYDQLGLLKPSQTDTFTSYRYYTIDQLARLNRIVALKELGFSLEQVSQLLEKEGDLSAEKLRGMLTLRRAEIEHEIQDKQVQLTEVESRLRQIEQEGQPSPYEIVIKSLQPQAVASIRQIVPTLGEMGFFCQKLYGGLYASLERHGITPLQPEITLYHNDEYQEHDLDVEVALPIQPKTLRQPPRSDDLTFRELPSAEIAALIYEGSFDEMSSAVLALLTYIDTHHHVLAGPLRELHLSGPAHDEQGRVQKQLVIELQAPVRKIEQPDI
ncbi:MAG: MerR family transcriptional regulator [Chloroflexi bacterium]|nr:MerR family transcriptional regulator [Chloroflexota bacterium]MBI5347824.1 MerR family transcriptional regulator [Chloroflexota bacterium]